MIIRRIEPRDNSAMESIIVEVMASFGAVGDGYSIGDPEVGAMYEAYAAPRSSYFVVEHDGIVLGGGGIGPLDDADEVTCELKKMYFLPAARGQGIGLRMLETCLASAREMGYARCYLETLGTMTDAIRLYERFGFQRLQAPMGNTGHYRTERWYILRLRPEQPA